MGNAFLEAITRMSGDSAKGAAVSGLNKRSNDMEILDYVMLQLCTCLDTSKMAFKGGYVLNKIITEETPRATVDIDFSIQVLSYYENVKKVLTSVGDTLVSDGVIDSYIIKDSIEEKMSGGISFHRESKELKDLGVDVGLHNIEYGTVPIIVNGIEAKRFSVERMLSDKIVAMFSRRRFRRPKDLYDFYIITSCYDVDIRELWKLIGLRGGLDWNAAPFSQDILKEYKRAYESLQIRTDGDSLQNVEKPEFCSIIDRLSKFVNTGNGEYNSWKCSTHKFL